VFSNSKSPNVDASEASIPPNLERHLQKVGRLKPPQRQRLLNGHTGFNLFEESDDFFVCKSCGLHIRNPPKFTDLLPLPWYGWQGADQNRYSWRESLSYAQTLSETNLAEKKWRLPSVVELYSISEHLQDTPAINTQWFPQTPAILTWSSSPNVQMPNQAWIVGFPAGYTGTDSVDVLPNPHGSQQY
jgi:Protein of unknown function (DUF1566)